VKEHEHATRNRTETKSAHDEVAEKAYAIYLKEGYPQGHAEQNWLEAEAQLQRAGSGHADRHGHHDHHAHMAADFRGGQPVDVCVIRMDEELMIAPSVWRVERTELERKVPPRAELGIEGATA